MGTEGTGGAQEPGCTECGSKGGCDDRKGGMFAAIDAALAALYPTRRWGERDDEKAFRAGVSPEEGQALAAALASRLDAVALYKPGSSDEYCDWIYVLCMGRTPSIIEVREAGAQPDEAIDRVDETYLRVSLSMLGRFAAVQQVSMVMRSEGGERVISEAPRTGVFDAPLLPRFQKLVALLAEIDIRHLDFGDMTHPPEGFDDGDYAGRFTGSPVVANYLFYPQPCSAISTTVLPI